MYTGRRFTSTLWLGKHKTLRCWKMCTEGVTGTNRLSSGLFLLLIDLFYFDINFVRRSSTMYGKDEYNKTISPDPVVPIPCCDLLPYTLRSKSPVHLNLSTLSVIYLLNFIDLKPHTNFMRQSTRHVNYHP